MDIANQLIDIFCEIDDFCKAFEKNPKTSLLPNPSHRPRRGPVSSLSTSEIMAILVMFQHVRFRHFKQFYCGFVCCYWQQYFPQLPSYQRFIELMQRAVIPLALFTQCRTGRRTGIYYIDSTCLPVCHLKRCKRHKTFKSVAQLGRTSVGWFFGLKLHLVINQHGQLITFKLTQGHRHDGQSATSLLQTLEGLIFGDKGYISRKLAGELLKKGLKLITRQRKNMKHPQKLSPIETQLLNQRNLIETVIDHLKHHYHVWHTRHRSILNAITHLVAALAAYAIQPLKLSSIKLISKTPN